MSETAWANRVEWENERRMFGNCDCYEPECENCHLIYHEDIRKWAKKGCPQCYEERKVMLMHDWKRRKGHIK